MAQTPELQMKISLWRAKALAGTLTLEETREAIQALREDRTRASEASTKAKTTKAKAKAKVDSDDLLSELDGL